MEIKDFSELNALNKLLGKIKFQEDLDFFEFKEFVNSPIIAELYKRVNEEFRQEAYKRGLIQSLDIPKFIYNSKVGKVITMRIDELTNSDIITLKGMNQDERTEYLQMLISPLQALPEEFDQLRKYLENRIK